MRSSRRVRRITALAVTVGLAVPAAAVGSTASVSAAPVGGGPRVRVVASGLDNPRHVTFSPTGALYVAEAGRGGEGPCSVHPQLGTFCLGFSGAVTRVRDRGPDHRVVTGVPSIINEMGETLGASDIAFSGSRRFVLSVGIGGSDEFRAGFGRGGSLLGTLVTGKLDHDRDDRHDRHGRHGGHGRDRGFSLFADVLANEAAANPDGTDIDSNPVGLLRRGSGYVIADAGGNAVVQVSHRGRFSTVAVLPPGSALAPPDLGLPPGTQIPTDAVPTSVVRGPDGAYYVSQLTGFPFEQGDANIWRIVPGRAPTVYASGLTNLTDLAFARDGTLYAVEIASTGLLNEPIGALKRITPGSNQHTTVLGGLFAPYGVALTRDAAYVTTCAICTDDGEVIKVSLD
jgi:hypothetical protein